MQPGCKKSLEILSTTAMGFSEVLDTCCWTGIRKFSLLRGVLESTLTDVILLPPRSPNLNAYVERFMRTMKSECLERMVFFGESSLRRALSEFELHYHAERNHQGLDNRLIYPGPEVGRIRGKIRNRRRLGGMLNYYHREAA